MSWRHVEGQPGARRALSPVELRKIRDARQASLRSQLIGDGLLPAQADLSIAAWLRNGGDPSTAAFWEAGYDWILGQLGRGEKA